MQVQTQFRVASAVQGIDAARETIRQDRKRGLARLNEIFRAGTPPDPALDDRYRGELVALDIAPGLTPLAQAIASGWMPWRGKAFDATQSTGVNIFTRDSLTLAHIFWPFYRHYRDDTPGTYRAFSFRTYLAPGLADPDHTVLKIDYDLNENPGPTIRRVLDELVQLDERFYLGKAHLHWWWGKWQTVAYFTLSAR